MEPVQMSKSFVDSCKVGFEQSYDAMLLFQQQMERMTKSFLDQSVWFPEESKKAYGEWAGYYKKAGQSLKASVDNSFKMMEGFIDAGTKK